MSTAATDNLVRTPEARRGFTLIELLVVIAIIALLVSILMPALSKAKVHAVRSSCLSNMRNTLLSLQMYAGDYGEFPVNIDPDRWDTDWLVPGPGTPWEAENRVPYGVGLPSEPMYAAIYPNGRYVAWPIVSTWEGRRGWPTHWRGHLIYGKYGAATSFGCSQSLPPDHIHIGRSDNGYNWWENTSPDKHPNRDKDLRIAPPYLYMGAGTDVKDVNESYTQGLETYPGWGSEGPRGRWKRYNGKSAPLMTEGFYRHQDQHPLYLTYYYHTRRLITAESEPWQRVRPIDTPIGWTDGHATLHVRDQLQPRGKFVAVNPGDWDQGP